MALQSSGRITLKEIAAEFGGDAPHGLKEYYRGGAYTTSNNTNVAVSPNLIGLKQFYGAKGEVSFTISSSQQEMNLSTYLTAQGWDGSAPVNVTINSGVYIWSDNTSVGGLTIPSSMNGLVTITNNGYIIGRGGDAGGNDGGPALVNNATGVTLTNASGAYIAGGGGGGGNSVSGGGAGGGNAYGPYGSRSGGAIGQAGQVGNGGGNAYHGGSGGNYYDAGSSSLSYPIGSGGGRILSSVGADGGGVCNTGPYGYGGGAGGVGNNAGSKGCTVNGTGGGGGWGAAGGTGGSAAGGAGGAAISGTAIANYTNNGTVYGSTA